MSTEVSTLVSMGFTASEAEAALHANGGDVERAVDQLVSGGTTAVPPSPANHTVMAVTTQVSPSTPNYQRQTLPIYQTNPPPPRRQYVTFSQDRRGVCYWSLNILWILLGGWHLCLSWFVTGAILCLTCVFFPCGWQVMKIAVFLLFPFGLSLVDSDDEIADEDVRCCSKCCNCFLNVVWAVTVGWILALQSIITGIVLCLTIIGIPFGIQCFTLAYLCFRPFGLRVSAEQLKTMEVVSANPDEYHHMQETRPTLTPTVL